MTATATATTRAYRLKSGDGVDGLRRVEEKVREPGPGEALVRVTANSLSFRELMVLRGDYVLPVKPDVIPISDGAGEVVAVGPGVTSVAPGDRVVANVFAHWQDGPFTVEHADQLGGSLDGLLTDLAVLPAHALLPTPSHLSDEEAATLPCAAVTAWHALEGVTAGQTVVVLGTGGVSLFALQLGQTMGARVIATTSSPAKAERLRELGAAAVVDRSERPDWEVAVRELTGGRGADRVVDVAGTVGRSLLATAFGGEVALVGFVGEGGDPIDPRVIFGTVATVRPVALGSRAHFAALNRVIELHGSRPVVDRVFGFDEAPDAYRHYLAGETFGKVVIAR